MKIRMLFVAAAMIVAAAFARAGSQGRRVFNVSDFGAVANSVTDSGPAIREAIAAAIACGQPADVVFGDGSYRVGSTKVNAWWPKSAIVVMGAKDLVLRGSGKTTIVVTDPLSAGVVLRDSEKVAAERLTIDYDPVPQITTKIVSMDPDHTSIEVEQLPSDPDMMTLADPLFLDPKMHLFMLTYDDGKPGEMVWGWEPVSLVEGIQTAPKRWKLEVPSRLDYVRRDAISVAGLRVGDKILASTFTNGGAAFSMLANKSAEARQITIHASPGLAFFPNRNDSVSILRCVIEIKPGSHRVLSSDADGIHARGNRHIVIEDSSISGTGDDAMNLHSDGIVPTQRVSETSFVFRGGTYSIRAGDTLELVRPTTSLVIGKYLVKSVDSSHKDGWHVDFADALPDVDIAKDFFCNLSEANNDFVVRNNVFGTHRGRDLLVQAYHGAIEHNRFVNRRTILKPRAVSSDPGFDQAMARLCGLSIQMAFEGNFPGGPITEGVTVRDNTFSGYELPSTAIYIEAMHSAKDITIEQNTFKNRNSSAIAARYVTNLVIKNNKVIGKGVSAGITPLVSAFDLQHCDGAVVLGNAVEHGLYAKDVSQ